MQLQRVSQYSPELPVKMKGLSLNSRTTPVVPVLSHSESIFPLRERDGCLHYVLPGRVYGVGLVLCPNPLNNAITFLLAR